MAVSDVLGQLLEFKWRDVSFPVSEFHTRLEQDLVQHKWPDRDGAHVEATGRAPLVFTATIHFRNYIQPGLAETWDSGNAALYPDVFRQFFIAMSKRTSGPLQHPEFGMIQCKPHSADTHWLAQRRDGCDVSASWIESLDDTVSDFKDILARKSPEPAALVTAMDLDTQIAQWNNVPVTTDSDPVSFTDEFNQVLSAFDTATLVSSQYAAKVDYLLYRVQALQDRVSAVQDITAWPLISSCVRATSALNDVKVLLLNSEREVQMLTVQQDTTLASLTITTRNAIDDLMRLNPALIQSPVVGANTIVRYYKAA